MGIQWCPANGEGLEEPSCHHRHGGKSRACLYKDCKDCTKESCDFKRSPDSKNNKQKIGHWYTYFKGSCNPNFIDSSGASCLDYKWWKWCTSNGEVGPYLEGDF